MTADTSSNGKRKQVCIHSAQNCANSYLVLISPAFRFVDISDKVQHCMLYPKQYAVVC